MSSYVCPWDADAAQLDDADRERRRDSRVYNLLQEQAARADKIREENTQIAAEQAYFRNESDKLKGRRCKARSPDREKGPRICQAAGSILGSRCLLAPVIPVVCGLL